MVDVNISLESWFEGLNQTQNFLCKNVDSDSFIIELQLIKFALDETKRREADAQG